MTEPAPYGGTANIVYWTDAYCPLGDGALRIADKEVHYITETGYTPRSIPYPAGAVLSLPALPSTIQGPEGTEYLYSGNNPIYVYQEPGTNWVLQLAISSRYQSEQPGSAEDFHMWYRCSNDGGSTFSSLAQVIQSGGGYTSMHPISVVWIGHNSYLVGAAPIVRANNGGIMCPFQYWPVDGSLNRINPLSASTFLYSGVLIANWNGNGTNVTWTLGNTVSIDANLSSRGCFEPAAVGQDSGGKVTMVTRGSNEVNPWVSDRKWVSYSTDYCATWSTPEVFDYSDNNTFYSPSSCSSLIRSVKNGRLYWIGNVYPTNPADPSAGGPAYLSLSIGHRRGRRDQELPGR